MLDSVDAAKATGQDWVNTLFGDGVAWPARAELRGLTLMQVADAVDRSVGWLSQVERNISEPSQSELAALARALDFSLESFYGRAPSPPEEGDVIVRAHARRRFAPRVEGLVEELLSPDLTDDFEVVHSATVSASGASRSAGPTGATLPAS